MPRRTESEDISGSLIDFFRDVPWWAGPPVAGATFALFAWAAPALLWFMSPSDPNSMTAPTFRLSTTISKGLAPFLGICVVVLWLVGLLLKLPRILRAAPKPPSASAPAQIVAAPAPEVPTAASVTAPVCPACGAAMVPRTAKKGPTPGSKFWGCPSFPNCRGTRDMQ